MLTGNLVLSASMAQLGWIISHLFQLRTVSSNLRHNSVTIYTGEDNESEDVNG
jgi:hypothetical protein